MMADDYNLKGRSGKQCKERYTNIFTEKVSVNCWWEPGISIMGVFAITETLSTA